MLSSTLGVEGEFSLRYFPHEHFVAGLQLEKPRRESAFRYQFKEKFDFIFKRRGDDRVWSLRPLAVVFHAQRRILSRKKLEFSAGLDADHPEIRRELHTLGDFGAIELFVDTNHS